MQYGIISHSQIRMELVIVIHGVQVDYNSIRPCVIYSKVNEPQYCKSECQSAHIAQHKPTTPSFKLMLWERCFG